MKIILTILFLMLSFSVYSAENEFHEKVKGLWVEQEKRCPSKLNFSKKGHMIHINGNLHEEWKYVVTKVRHKGSSYYSLSSKFIMTNNKKNCKKELSSFKSGDEMDYQIWVEDNSIMKFGTGHVFHRVESKSSSLKMNNGTKVSLITLLD